MKKVATTVLISVVLIWVAIAFPAGTQFAVAESAVVQTIEGFKDVPNTHWAKASIGEAVKQGIVTGYPDGTFRPSNTITRAEVASMLSRVTKLVPTANSDAFMDLDKHWSKDAVREMVSLGFIKTSDYPKGFEPDKAITRFELMKWMASGLSASSESFKQALADTKDTLLPTPESFKGGISAGQVPYIAVVRGAGIVNGFPDGSFKPADPTTRAEVVAMVLRYSKVEGTSAAAYSDLQEMVEVSRDGMNSGLIKEMVFDDDSLKFKDIANKTFDFKNSDVVLHRIIFVDGRTSEYKGLYAPLFIGKKTNEYDKRILAFTDMTFTYQEDKPYMGALSQEVEAEMRDISNMMELLRIDWENAQEKQIPTLPIANVNKFVLPNKPVNIWVRNQMMIDQSYYIKFGKGMLYLTTLSNPRSRD